jgi:hypothetical protein
VYNLFPFGSVVVLRVSSCSLIRSISFLKVGALNEVFVMYSFLSFYPFEMLVIIGLGKKYVINVMLFIKGYFFVRRFDFVITFGLGIVFN